MQERPATSPRVPRRPATLMPAMRARLVAFAALALLGALQWERMVDGSGGGRAVGWVLLALGAARLLLWADRPGRLGGFGVLAVAGVGLLGAYAAAGLPLELLRPGRWPELGDGLGRGAEALSTVQLPYAGADPWPRHALRLAGSLLCVTAGLLAVWPREERRGYPLFSLMAMLVLVASPMVSIGASSQWVLGALLAVLTIGFLWLERLPLRPGLGAAALLLVAVAGALPLAAAADKEEPWFDYRGWAEALGEGDAVRFAWGHSYGPITWPRDGKEVMRVAVRAPSYWTMEHLDAFDGRVWRVASDPASGFAPGIDGDSPAQWRARPSWTRTVPVINRRLSGTDLAGAGTTLGVQAPELGIIPSGAGTWDAARPLRNGDAYTVRAYVPQPSPFQLAGSDAGADGAHGDSLRVALPFRPDAAPVPDLPPQMGGAEVRWAQLRFPSFARLRAGARPLAEYPTVSMLGSGSAALRRSGYVRTWRLAQDLLRRSRTPYEYVVAVERRLRDGFTYDERPAPVPAGTAPLDGFLFDTRSGYCQHYSGAMALLLRMGGVPARVVTGFSPGGYSERKQAWVVRDTDAHSWVEAWFDEFGWVTFDPTPPDTPARSQVAALDDPDEGSDSGAAGDAGGGDAAGRGAGVRPDLLGRARPGTGAAGGAGATDGGASAWWWASGGAAALIALLALWAVLRRRRRRHGGPVAHLERAIAELECALRRSGRPTPAATTLTQLEQRLGRTPEAAAYLRALRTGRYAPRAQQPTAAGRRALRRELAGGRGLPGRLRALWALPPWGA